MLLSDITIRINGYSLEKKKKKPFKTNMEMNYVKYFYRY